MTYSILLGGGTLLDSESVVEQAVAGEVFAHVLLHEFDMEIRVVDTLDLVTDTAACYSPSTSTQNKNTTMNRRTELVLLPGLVGELTRSQTSIPSIREHREAASSRAPPNRLPIVKTPEANDKMRSLPARVGTMVFMAPDTAGPWSAVSMRTISMNLVAQGGRPRK
jgi:hypothetical protein